MKVPFFDLRVTDNVLRGKLLASVEHVLEHGRLILGPEVELFEEKIAKEVGVKYALGVASGSSALYMSLKATGIMPGDEVITTPLTWIITLNAIAVCGAVPICVDVGKDFNIDPTAIEAAITNKTKAIVPMHYCGKMCDMEAIQKIANRHNLLIIEDAAQAYGATFKSKKAGTYSKVSMFSMNTMKSLASYGEAGVIVTDDKDIYDIVKMIRYAGTKSDPKKIVTNDCYYSELNHKLDTIQASLLLVAMEYYPEKMFKRTRIANRYNQLLSKYVDVPQINRLDIHALYSYTIGVNQRDEMQKYLNENGIETKIYHLPLAIDAPVYRSIRKLPIPTARVQSQRCLSIPAHEKLSDEQVEYVASKVIEFCQKNSFDNQLFESVKEGVML